MSSYQRNVLFHQDIFWIIYCKLIIFIVLWKGTVKKVRECLEELNVQLIYAFLCWLLLKKVWWIIMKVKNYIQLNWRLFWLCATLILIKRFSTLVLMLDVISVIMYFPMEEHLNILMDSLWKMWQINGSGIEMWCS